MFNQQSKGMSQSENESTWYNSLQAAFYSAYQGIAETIASPFQQLTTWWYGENQDKVHLEKMRAHYYQRIEEEQQKPEKDFVQISKDISQDTRDYVNEIVAEEIKKLGPLPCEFSIVTLGSLARAESGPVTDLEIGFLIDKKNVTTYKYFYELSQRLSDRLFLLGEHPDVGGKGLRIDEADNAPPHLKFFARNLTPEQNQQLLSDAIKNREWDKIPYEGSRPFLATPEEFASFSKEGFSQDKRKMAQLRKQEYNKELRYALRQEQKNTGQRVSPKRRKEIENEVRFWVNNMYRPYSNRELNVAEAAGRTLGRNVDHLFGSESVSARFQEQKDLILSEVQANGLSSRQTLARNGMIEDINSRMQAGKSIFVTGELGKTIDLKRDLYRFVEQFVTNVGFYNHCESQNTYDIISELVDKKLMDPRLGYQIQDFIQFATGLRLKQQKALKRQGFAAYIDEDAFADDKKDLEEEIQRLEKSIENFEALNYNPEAIAGKKRELNKLRVKYDHFLEMAPGLVLSDEDLATLESKYVPMGQEIFQAAQNWIKDPSSLQAKYQAEAPVEIEDKAEAELEPTAKAGSPIVEEVKPSVAPTKLDSSFAVIWMLNKLLAEVQRLSPDVPVAAKHHLGATNQIRVR